MGMVLQKSTGIAKRQIRLRNRFLLAFYFYFYFYVSALIINAAGEGNRTLVTMQ